MIDTSGDFTNPSHFPSQDQRGAPYLIIVLSASSLLAAMMESTTDKSTSSSANDGEVEWLQVNNSNVNSHSKLSTFATNKNTTHDIDDEELQSLSSHTDGGSKRKKKKNKFQSLELGHEDNRSYSSDDDSGSSDDEEYELTDNNQYEPTISDHISGNTSSLVSTIIWRTKEKIRCRILLLLATLLIIILIVYTKQGDGISLLKSSNNDKKSHPPGAVGVGHASYDAIESAYLYEYKAQLSLYRHRTSGAEFLTFVPDKSGGEGSFGSSSNEGGSGYDPKPDKVFGIAFRTKPESSTGVPHILERE